jgi:hypothetical protein
VRCASFGGIRLRSVDRSAKLVSAETAKARGVTVSRRAFDFFVLFIPL